MKIKKYIQLTVLILIILFSSKSFAQNTFVQEDVVKVSGATTGAQVLALGVNDRTTTRTYFDGLGRAIQTIAVAASPNQKDIIQPVAYNTLGQQVKNYLPYASSARTGYFRSSALTEQASYYSNGTTDKVADDSYPYSERLFENSPLQRVMKQGNFGDGFQLTGIYNHLDYRTNTNSETVRRWNPDGSSAADYGAGKLSVENAYGVDDSYTLIYRDNSGRVVLKVQDQGSSYLYTYYVYNDAGQLVYVIPPLAVTVMNTASNYSLSQTAVDKLLFKYVYDVKGRLIERTVPGSGVVYMVYDPFDRLVLAQDAKMRTSNKWNYIKYDSQDRVISQGIYTDTDVLHATRSDMQSYVDGLSFTNYYEERNSTSGTGYYTNVSFPTSNATSPSSAIEPLAYSYFDDYDVDGNGTADYSYQSQSLTGEGTATDLTRGMLTVVRKRTIGSGLSNIWLTSVVFYDRNGRTIQTQGNNQLTSSVSSIGTIVPDFTGKTIRTKSVQVAGSTTTTVYSELTYDHVGRLKTVDEKYNSGSFIRIAGYDYNELGQLVDRKLHSTNSGSSYLQSVDYRYTIQGWLKSINNSTLTVDSKNNDDSNDLFGMELLRDDNDLGISNNSYYSGQISAIKWKANAPGIAPTSERSFTYSYDFMHQLKEVFYADRSGSGSWGNTGDYYEVFEHDDNGNISFIYRLAKIGGTGTAIDNLTLSYDGNRLDNATDGSGSNYTSYGFKNLTGSNSAYTYDANGNMITDPKKGLTLTYNDINRTDRITMTASAGRYIDYTYASDGTLLRKQTYDNSTLVTTTDYIGGFVYENGTLAYFPMAEGRVRNASGTLKNEYFIKDQMGNVRVSFEDVSGVATVRQENSYYAFGMSMPGNTIPSADNKKLFNGGSEWQNDFADLPDMQQTFYRNYDPALGRFIGVDPNPESAESMTTYQYAMNNPMIFNDPLGDQAAPITGTYGGMHGGYGRIGSGSGKAWSDGIYYDDWNAWTGSDMYRSGIAAGLHDTNGYLYSSIDGSDGKLIYNPSGQLGFYGRAFSYRENDAGEVYNSKGEKSILDSHSNNLRWTTVPQPTQMESALSLAATLSVADGPFPVGDAIGAAIVSIVAVNTPAIAGKMRAEIDRIRERTAGPDGFTYKLVVNRTGDYLNVRGNIVHLNAGDVWKYGETTQGYDRYSSSELSNMVPGGVQMIPVHFGTQVDIKIHEKVLIYGYFIGNGSLPPGNRIFR